MLVKIIKAIVFAVIFFVLHVIAVNLSYYVFNKDFVISPSNWHYFGWVEYLAGAGILIGAALVLELIRAFKSPLSFVENLPDGTAIIIKALGFTVIMGLIHITAVNISYYVFHGATIIGHWEWLGWNNSYVLGTVFMLVAVLVVEFARALMSKNR